MMLSSANPSDPAASPRREVGFHFAFIFFFGNHWIVLILVS
jgi:hypothetical protein